MISGFRPGAVVQGSGNVSDHSADDANRAARDLSNSPDPLNGPPTPEMDRAVEEIGRAYGRQIDGSKPVQEFFDYNGLKMQIIYRTPPSKTDAGHMGHIHVSGSK